MDLKIEAFFLQQFLKTCCTIFFRLFIELQISNKNERNNENVAIFFNFHRVYTYSKFNKMAKRSHTSSFWESL